MMINPKKFMPLENRWQDIYKHLEKEGFKVYAPYMDIGECKDKYIVIKFYGSTKILGISSNQDLYQLLCYVPKNKYSILETFKQEVKKSMEDLRPMILPYGQEEISYYDDNIKAHYVGLIYKNYKRNKGE